MQFFAKAQGAAGKAVTVLAITVIVLGMYYGPLLYRESNGNPLPILWAVARLELTGTDLVAVSQDATILMQKCCPQPLSKPLTSFLSARGWIYQDQMGAGIFYQRGADRLVVTSRSLSRQYVVYRLARTP